MAQITPGDSIKVDINDRGYWTLSAFILIPHLSLVNVEKVILNKRLGSCYKPQV